jgi:Dockerin type I domain
VTIQDGGQAATASLKIDRINVIGGTPLFNDLVLVVDPVTGAATVQNQSTQAVDFIGYSISSLSGALLPGYPGSGKPGWLFANPTTSNLAEVGPNSSIHLGVGGELALGTAWDSNGLGDLTFVYQTVDGAINQGIVYFGQKPTVSLSGDYNGNGKVDAADYVVWRKNLGKLSGATSSQGDGDGDGDVDSTDYNTWRSNFGVSLGAGSGAGLNGSQVPEPSTIVFLTLILGTFIPARLRRQF